MVFPRRTECITFLSDAGDKEYFEESHCLGISRKCIYDGNLETAVQRKSQHAFFCQTANQYGTKEVNSIAFE